MKIYDYIVTHILFCRTRSNIKHKNSEDISEYDYEKANLLETNDNKNTPMNTYSMNGSKVSPITSRSKIHVSFKKYPTYQCEHCSKSVENPQYLFQDMVYCSNICRTQYISGLVDRTKENTCA